MKSWQLLQLDSVLQSESNIQNILDLDSFLLYLGRGAAHVARPSRERWDEGLWAGQMEKEREINGLGQEWV
jgi:hypothetical protein